MRRALLSLSMMFSLAMGLLPRAASAWVPGNIDQGFSAGQCTNYAAHAREDLWPVIKGHWAGGGFWNAGQWDDNFRSIHDDGDSEYVVDDTAEAGAILVFDPNVRTDQFNGQTGKWETRLESGSVGHVAYTTQVGSDYIVIDDQNENNDGMVRMDVKLKVSSGMHFIHTLVYSRQVAQNNTGGPWAQTQKTLTGSFTVALPVRNVTVRSASEFVLWIDGEAILSSQRPSGWDGFRKTLWLSTGRHEYKLDYWEGEQANGSKDRAPEFEQTWWPNSSVQAAEGEPALPVNYAYNVEPAQANPGDTVSVRVTASLWQVSDRIRGVDLLVDGRRVDHLDGHAGTLHWDTSDSATGQHALSLAATVDGYSGEVAQKQLEVALGGNSSPPASGGRPDAPALASPDEGARLSQGDLVILRWQDATNAVAYKVDVWGGPYQLMTPCDWGAATHCKIGQMWPGTMSWHVKARNASGQESDWSETRSFTVGPAAPPQADRPQLASPGNGEIVAQTTEVNLKWNDVGNGAEYLVELWGGPYSKMIPCSWQAATKCHIGQMWPGTMSWHVKARRNGQETEWSDTWTFTVAQGAADTPVPAAPTDTPVPYVPPTDVPAPTSAPQAGYVELVDNLTLRTESGVWPPQAGQKIIAHIKIRNGGDQALHIAHIGVRGRRNGSESWDIGFWEITLNGHDTWSLDPNNERPLVLGNYSFRISYSLDGSHWTEIGDEINFTVP